jgi:hypothetical protein
MSAKVTWVEMEVRGEEALRLIKQVMDSKCTGQIVLNVSQGTVGSAKWREKVQLDQTGAAKILLDTGTVSQDTF